MRQCGEERSQLGRHSRGADAVGALFLVVQHAHEDGDDGENHDHFNGHCQHADDGAQRTVNQIGEDELVHSRSWFQSTSEGRICTNAPVFRVTAWASTDERDARGYSWLHFRLPDARARSCHRRKPPLPRVPGEAASGRPEPYLPLRLILMKIKDEETTHFD